jgi:hypothetical protein
MRTAREQKSEPSALKTPGFGQERKHGAVKY